MNKVLVNFLIFLYIIPLIMDIIDEEENTNNKTEKDYLDLAEDCKNIVEEKNKEVTKWKKEYMRLKKLIGKIYGLSRSAEEYLDNFIEADNTLDKFLNMIRSDCSDVLYTTEEIHLGIIDTEEDFQFTINVINNED